MVVEVVRRVGCCFGEVWVEELQQVEGVVWVEVAVFRKERSAVVEASLLVDGGGVDV